MSRPTNALVILTGRSLDQTLKRLKRDLGDAGVGASMRRHEYHLKPSVRRRLKADRARKKAMRRAEREAAVAEQRQAENGARLSRF